MNVIQMPTPIFFVSNPMLPKTPLPNRFFTTMVNCRWHTMGNPLFEQPPTAGVIAITLRELPKTVQMVG